MKAYFLGTGTSQGIPIIGVDHPVCLSTNTKDKRLRSSIWIHDENLSLVIDCGPDFRQQMLRCGCTFIDGILFTHEHADHTAGIDDIRPFNFLQGDIEIYSNQRVIDNLKKRFDYIFETENKYPGAPAVNVNCIENEFYIKNKKIVPINILHGNLPILGFRIGDFAYITDAKYIEETELEKLKNLDVLVINALRIEPHGTHLNLEEALNFIKIMNPKRAYLTHISHLLGFHNEVSKLLPENVFVAYDNLEINF